MIKLILILLAAVSLACAEDIYVAQTAKGRDTGTDAINAHAITWFNTGANWSAAVSNDGMIGPGDTVHLTGTLTSQLVIQRSGTEANRITIKFDPGSVMEHPTWTSSGAIYGPGVSNITIEGKNSAPVKQTLTAVDIRATQNGTARPLQVDGSRWIYFENSSGNITLRNLWMTDLYVRTYQHPSDRHATASGVSIRAQNNVVIENCAAFHAETGLTISNLGSGLSEGFVIQNCLVSDCSNGIKMGASGTAGPPLVQTPKIIRNRIDHMARWGGIETNGFHADGIQTISQGAARIDNLHVAYNHIGPNVGRSGDLTALIFLEDFVNGSKIYNNFLEYATGHHSSNPAITAATYPSFYGQPFGLRTLIVNNTILLSNTSTGVSSGFAEVKGNIIYRAGNFLSIWENQATNANGPYMISDRNAWHEAVPGNARFGIVGLGQGQYSITAWKNAGYDLNSLFADPKLNANGTLQVGSPAIGFAPTQTIFNDDFFGNVRTVPWDAGAFETQGGAAQPINTLNVQTLRITGS